MRGQGEVRGKMVPIERRLVEVTSLEHLGTHECENKRTGERQYAKQGKVRVKKGRAAMHQLSMLGGCNGGLPIADAIKAAQMGTLMTLQWGCEISGRMITPNGGRWIEVRTTMTTG